MTLCPMSNKTLPFFKFITMYSSTISYRNSQFDEAVFRRLTGLRPPDFEAFHDPFRKAWDDYFENFTLEGKVRYRKFSTRKNSVFPDTKEALFFALVYLKGNIRQEELAAQFGIDQPKTSKYLFLIRNLLVQTIKTNQKILPKTKLERIRQSVAVR